MQIENRLGQVLLHLRQSGCSAEDDTVLNKLHTGIHNLFLKKNLSDRVAVVCKSCGLWDYLLWCCVETNTVSHPSLLCLALKCTASLVQISHDLEETDMLQLLQMLTGVVKGAEAFTTVNKQQQMFSGSISSCNGIETSNHGLNSSLKRASNGTATVSPSSSSLLQNKIDHPECSSEPDCAAMKSIPEKKLVPFPKHVDCTVVCAALTVICALVNHNTGRKWLQAQGLVSSLVAPCLLYPSVFVQRAAIDALTGLMQHETSYSNEKSNCLWDLLLDLSTPASSPAVDRPTPRQLLSIYSSLLDKTPLGQCPRWRLQLLTQHCSALQCLGPEKAIKDHLTIRLALHQYVLEVFAADGASDPGSCVQAEGAVLAIVEDFLRPESNADRSNTRCWAQLLQLGADVHLVLAERGASTSFCSALDHLASSVQLLPAAILCSSSTGSSQQQTMAQAAVRPLIMHCGRDCVRLLHIKEAIQAHVAVLQGESSGRLRRLAADATKGLAAAVRAVTLERCVPLLEQCQQQLLSLLPAPDSSSADAPHGAVSSCLLALIDLLETLLKRLGRQCPDSRHSAELCAALCRLLHTPGNEPQLIVGVLNCLRLRLLTTEPAADDADRPLQQCMSRALCHTSWDVQDSALELLSSALELHPRVGASWMMCPAVQRSAVALLSSDEPFVQCSAAAVLEQAAHHAQMCGSIEWSTVHHWSVSVCCSSDALAGCEGDTVTAAACRLLASLHHTPGLDAGCSFCSASGSRCRAASLLHAQHYCTSDSDLLRAAGQRYLKKHITGLLQEENETSNGRSVEDRVKASLERCCREGSAWCVLRGCSDVVASVSQEAATTRDLLQHAASTHGLGSSLASDENTPSSEAAVSGSAKRLADDVTGNDASPKRLCSSPATAPAAVSPVRKCPTPQETGAKVERSTPTESRVLSIGTKCAEEENSNGSDAAKETAVLQDKKNDSYEDTTCGVSEATVDIRTESGGPRATTVQSSSEEADVIMEEVLDFSDLATLAGLRRPGTRAPASTLTERPPLPAVPLTGLFDSSATQADIEPDEEREFLSLLEDIMLGVSASDGDGPCSPELVFGPPSHHTMDCY